MAGVLRERLTNTPEWQIRRNRAIASRRNAGESVAELAADYGITGMRVRDIVRKYSIEPEVNTVAALPTRIRSVLHRLGVSDADGPQAVASVYAALAHGTRRQLLESTYRPIKNFGVSSLAVVREWLISHGYKVEGDRATKVAKETDDGRRA